MKMRLLDWVVCPLCRGSLRLDVADDGAPAADSGAADGEVRSGMLTCGCGRAYPVIDGLPRLLPEAEQEYPEAFRQWRGGAAAGPPAAPPQADRRSRASFGFQWATYREGELTWFKRDRSQRKDEFLRGMQVTAADLRGRTLLDAGCGNGELTRSLAEYGLEIVALDFSRSVEQAQARLRSADPEVASRVHYLQGDVLHLPLRDAAFDLVHSSGVLHHTASTQRAFASLTRAVRPGGRLYVQLYRRRPGWIHAVNVGLRALTTRLPLRLLWALCWLLAPVHGLLSRLMHALRGETYPGGTRRERALQMFDNYSPRYQHRHTVPEILDLFRSAGFLGARDVTFADEQRHMLAVLGDLDAAPEGGRRQPVAAAPPAAPRLASVEAGASPRA